MYRLKFVRMYANAGVLYQAYAKAPAIPFAVTIKAASTVATEYHSEFNTDLIFWYLSLAFDTVSSSGRLPVEYALVCIVVGRSALDVTPSPLCTDTVEVCASLDSVTCTTVMSQSYSTSPVTTSMKPSRYLRS